MHGRKNAQPFIDQVPDGPMNFETLDGLQWEFRLAAETFDAPLVEKYMQRFADVPHIVPGNVSLARLLQKMNDDKDAGWADKTKTFALLLSASSAKTKHKDPQYNNALAYLIADEKMPVSVRQDLLGMLLNSKLLPLNDAYCTNASGEEVTPLIYAVMKSNLLAVEMLLTRDDLDVNCVPEGGEPALIVALKYKGIPDDIRKDIVAALMIDERTDPNVLSQDGKTALQIAAQHYDAEMIGILNRVDTNVAGTVSTLLHQAVMSRKVENVKACLARKDLDPNLIRAPHERAALDIALSYQTSTIADVLLNDPRVSVARKNVNGQNALHVAIIRGHGVEVCRAILEKQAQVFTPVGDKGKEEQDVEPVCVIEKITVLDCDVLNNTPLVLAAMHGRKDVAKWLLSLQNNDVNKRGNENKSALHYFALNGEEDLVADFLKHREVGEVALNAVDVYGHHALHFAAMKGHTQVVKQLLNSGRILPGKLGVDGVSEMGETPLMLAAQFGDVDMVKALINAGADVMRTNIVNQKPNEIALEWGKSANASALIEAQIQQGKLGNVSAISMFQPAIAANAKKEQRQKTAPRGPN